MSNPPMYVPHEQQQHGYVPPPYTGMPAQPQPQPFALQGQPMMYAAAPVVGQPANPAPVDHVVVINHGMAVSQPLGRFSDGLFDCLDDCSSCLLAYCCLPIRWGMTVSRAGFLTLIGAIVAFGLVYVGETILSFIIGAVWSTCNQPNVTCQPRPIFWVMVALLPICIAIRLALGTIYRGKIRAQSQIPGSAVEDCCLHFFCSWCAVAQESRHTDRLTGYLHMPMAQRTTYQQFQ